ncbi:MAG: ankyrin repeat domain-containing protein [Inhella sp.]|jgi:ankyrin repeat protein|uniref:ankyrin repeat domain-containing protein n=1 Tax=Inhella sp. TaxID=1921806 RepID=UPI00391CB29F
MMRAACVLLAALWGTGAAWAQGEAAVREWLKWAELDSAPLIKQRLAAGQDPNVIGERGQAALHWALLNRSWRAAVVVLEDPRTDVNLRNANGETPLMLAALRGRLDLAQALVQRGAKVHVDSASPSWQAVHYAATADDQGEALLRWLVAQGADVNAQSPTGKTALMLAWAFGSVDGARWLMRNGARVEVLDERGQTAWDHAVRAGRSDLAQRAGLAARP